MVDGSAYVERRWWLTVETVWSAIRHYVARSLDESESELVNGLVGSAVQVTPRAVERVGLREIGMPAYYRGRKRLTRRA